MSHLSLHWQTKGFIMGPSQGPGHPWRPVLEMKSELEWTLVWTLAFCQQNLQPLTMWTSHISNKAWGGRCESKELTVDTLWDLTLSELCKCLESLSTCIRCLPISSSGSSYCAFLAQTMFFRNMRPRTPLHNFYLCGGGFWISFLCHSQEQLQVV